MRTEYLLAIILLSFEPSFAIDNLTIQKLVLEKKLTTIQKIDKLNSLLLEEENSKEFDRLLLEMGKLLLNVDISISDYKKDLKYRNVYQLSIIKSANYGNFVGYTGYHFKKIISDYPNSEFLDDAEYYLIYSLPEEYNYDNLKEEKGKLEGFLKKYPDSNLSGTVRKRIKWLRSYIKNGQNWIVD
ncbi:tetratricopeptide repeat protein [Leptospira wolffii]|uniref:tetratricopeptide repeat protein n=1 Tax=Leptospira wolffii TaxID=409998 RepID=UPI000352DFAA|nr:hypothetical protein [Leptospira wolffii]EPG64670.1 hypothetical protein LEP1GSC061_0997 [Leptospira wolffii serovar Khorat str. Khorat-H2]